MQLPSFVVPSLLLWPPPPPLNSRGWICFFLHGPGGLYDLNWVELKRGSDARQSVLKARRVELSAPGRFDLIERIPPRTPKPVRVGTE